VPSADRRVGPVRNGYIGELFGFGRGGVALVVHAASRFRVRPVAAADEAAWRRLWQSYCDFYGIAIPGAVTDTLWYRLMDGSTPIHALIAESAAPSQAAGALAGFANFVLHPYTWGTELICYLEDLFVEEHARGMGLGSALI